MCIQSIYPLISILLGTVIQYVFVQDLAVNVFHRYYFVLNIH